MSKHLFPVSDVQVIGYQDDMFVIVHLTNGFMHLCTYHDADKFMLEYAHERK